MNIEQITPITRSQKNSGVAIESRQIVRSSKWTSRTLHKKNPWTKMEDAKLTHLIEMHDKVLSQKLDEPHDESKKRIKGRSWAAIAKDMDSRTGKQCRERWQNHLQPDLKKGTWTEEEDRLVISLQKLYGNKWTKIKPYLPGRTDNDIKNRWHAGVRVGRIDSATNTPIKEASPNMEERISSKRKWTPSEQAVASKGRKQPKLSKQSVARQGRVTLPNIDNSSFAQANADSETQTDSMKLLENKPQGKSDIDTFIFDDCETSDTFSLSCVCSHITSGERAKLFVVAEAAELMRKKAEIDAISPSVFDDAQTPDANTGLHASSDTAFNDKVKLVMDVDFTPRASDHIISPRSMDSNRSAESSIISISPTAVQVLAPEASNCPGGTDDLELTTPLPAYFTFEAV